MSAWRSLLGRNQQLEPWLVERRVAMGMSVREVEASLALPAGSLDAYSTSYADQVRVSVSDPGLGAMFGAQHGIILVFDPNGGLRRGFAETVTLVDEAQAPINLLRLGREDRTHGL